MVVRVVLVVLEDVVLELGDHVALLLGRERQRLDPDRAIGVLVARQHVGDVLLVLVGPGLNAVTGDQMHAVAIAAHDAGGR